jgi:tripartite-type tricarboxylate transporter receptor subunit TctC
MNREGACTLRVLDRVGAHNKKWEGGLKGFSCFTALMLGFLPWAPAQADVAGFYRNHPITILVGNNAGVSYDISARLIGRHLSHHIPGSPTIVAKNMPGASGLIATNHAYNVAPQDGTVLVATLPGIAMRQILGDENVKFDANKLHWIGNPATPVIVMATWHASPVKTMTDALRQPVQLGATTRDSSGGVTSALANNLLGTKFKLITGYKGSDIDLAMERGEVDGRAAQFWDGWKLARPDWVRDKKLNVLVQFGVARAKDLPDVPLMSELVKNDEQRRIVDLFVIPIAMGRPLFVAPGVPADRVDALREAFRRTMGDAAFLAEANKIDLEIEPMFGEELQALVSRMMTTPADVVAKAKEAMDYR